MCSWELFSSAAFSLISFKVADYWLVCVLRQELTTLESCSNKNTCLIFTLSDSPMTQCHNNQTQKWTQSDKFHMFHKFHMSERTHVGAYPRPCFQSFKKIKTKTFLTSMAAAWLPVDLRKNLELGTQKVEKWVLGFFNTWSNGKS